MEAIPRRVKIVNVFGDLRSRTKQTPYGTVGYVHRGSDLEVVVVRKEGEAIDPDWYSQPTTDHILVLQGRLKVEFPRSRGRILHPGDLLVLPKNTRCRAYSYPRRRGSETVFLAFYRKPAEEDG